MTEVASDRLTDEAKRLWMTGPKLQQYRKVVESSGLLSTVDAVVDGTYGGSMSLRYDHIPIM